MHFPQSHLTLCAVLLAVSAPCVHAQTNALPTVSELEPLASPANDAPVSEFTLPLQNVSPSFAAYWLDPAHNAAPLQMRISGSDFLHLKNTPRLPGNANGPVDLKLPAGVKSVEPIDSQSKLKVLATPEGFAALKGLQPTFDVQLIQYEVETRFYQIDRRDLKKLGLKFQPNSEYKLGSVANASDIMKEFAKLPSKRVKVLATPRMTVIDGLEAAVQQNTSTSFAVDEKLSQQQPPQPNMMTVPAEKIQQQDWSSPPGIAMVTSSIGVRAIVVRRPGNLITLGLAPTYNDRTLSLETTMREDTTLAIPMSPSEAKEQFVAFVKVTRVRRVGDEDNAK